MLGIFNKDILLKHICVLIHLYGLQIKNIHIFEKSKNYIFLSIIINANDICYFLCNINFKLKKLKKKNNLTIFKQCN